MLFTPRSLALLLACTALAASTLAAWVLLSVFGPVIDRARGAQS